MVSLFSAIFPPAPTFTDKSIGDQSEKVFLVTGAASGVGFEVARILYSKNGTVHVAARSAKRANEAIEKIRTAVPISKGQLKVLVIDLADLASIKAAAEAFLKEESRLDILVHNAGVMEPPAGSKTNLGHDLEMGTHCLGPFLLTHLLQGIMKDTAAKNPSPSYSVRIVWITTLLQVGAPTGAMLFDDDGAPKVLPQPMANYFESKVGEAWLASEFAARLNEYGIMSLSVHPGLMRTELQRTRALPGRILMSILFKPAVYGAYSELFGALSPLLKEENNGGYILAWGRVASLPDEVASGLKTKEHGGTGKSQMFWEYCQRETKPFIL